MMKRLIFFAVFICVFSIHYEVNATNGTNVKGILRTDTVWTKEGSPYNLVDNIQVGGKLTIEPGVTVIGNRKDIAIFGDLEVLGSKEERIRLMSVNLKSGDYFKKFKLNILHSDLLKCNFALNNFINNNITLSDSWIDDSIGQSTFIPLQDDYNGYAHFFGYGATIERNVFSNILPISVGSDSTFTSNVFLKNYKLNISSDINITFNFNSFLGEENDIINLNSYTKINNIDNNFWNTDTEEKISERIYDADDDLSVHNKMDVKSFLTSPHESTPSLFPFKAPNLTSVYTQNSTSVEGVAEPNSILYYNYQSTSPYEVGGDQGVILVDSTGEFKIDSMISGEFTMKLFSIKGGVSSAESNTVAIDRVPPLPPNVDDISDQTEGVTGSAEGGAKIIVKKGSEILGSSDAILHPSVLYERYYMHYNVSIPKQVEGTKLSVYAIDLVGNISDPKEIIVKKSIVKDTIAPPPPFVGEITDRTQIVQGKAEPGSTVSFKSGLWIIGNGLVDSEGNFSIPIMPTYAGNVLSVFATDESGNISEITRVIVKDATPPSSPSIIEVTEQSVSVMGWAEPNSSILITSGSNILGTAITSEYGMFEVLIASQSANTVITIIAIDAAGNKSKEIKEWVKDITPPKSPEVYEFTDQMTTISGETEAFAEITVKVDNNILGTIQAGADGRFSLEIPSQIAGVKVSVIATDQSGHTSEETTLTVKDVTAPEAPKVDELTDQMTTVSGQAEVAAEVTVKVGDKTLDTTKVGTDGLYKLAIPRQVAGTKVSVVAKDLAGNSSAATVVTVKDVTAPEAPKVDELTDQMTTVSGQAEVAAEVTVKVGDKTLGTTKVGTDGLYKLTISRQVAGTKVSIVAKDLAGNSSVEVVITVKDVTPPAMPKVGEVTDQSLKVDGFAEPLSKIILKSNGKIIKEGIVAKDGKYSISITKQKAGNELMLIAIDKYGNQSAPKKVIVVDKTPPVLLAISPVSDQSKSIKGRTEIGAKVYIKSGKKVIGSTTSTKEEFSIKIAKQKAGTKLTIFAVDSSGNRSKEKQVIVSDRTPPDKPIVAKVTFKDKFLKGKTEKNAKILVYSNSKKIGEGKADSKGYFKIAIKAQKRGSSLKIYSQDKYSNRSKETIIKVS